MTQDEIIEMAKESNLLGVIDSFHYNQNNWLEEATAFAKLVAAKEREACAKVCEELAELSRVSDTDSMWEWGECAAAIRARGNP